MGHDSVQAFQTRLQAIQATIPASVRLIAVSKTVPAAQLRLAYAAGVRDFAESRVQEAIAKQAELADLTDITWHFIGHLQRNKAQAALKHFTWIHSVDSLKLARRLNTLAVDLPQPPQVCLQVKPLPDPGKYGWEFAPFRSDWPQLLECEHLHLRGLMTILPQGLSETDTLAGFQRVQQLAIEIRNQSPDLQFDQLSMGMSADYPLAIQAGATMIRPGRVLFGDRPTR